MNMRAIFLISAILLVPIICNAAPTVGGISGVVQHDGTITITGSSFGIKATAAPVAWDNLEDGTCNTTATVGSWSSVHDLSISTANQRHARSKYNAGINFNKEAWGNFTGGSDAPTWFVQYWFYLDNDFNFSSSIDNNLGNIKIFRMWSTGSGTNNLRVQLLNGYTSDLVVEVADVGHGGYSVGWTPVNSSGKTIDQTLGHSAPSEILPGDLGWRNYDNGDIPKGTWHLFQFEYKESSIDNYDGVFRWWFDGKLIVNVNDVRTRTTAQPSSMRPSVVGWYNSHGTGADGNDHFYLDDAYIDTSWARVEIGNASTYNACTLREIQIPASWSNGSVSVKVNQGAFSNGTSAYLYVVDPNGSVNSNGYPITIGSGGSVSDITPPAKPAVKSIIAVP